MAVDSSSADGPDGLPETVIDDLLADPRRELLLQVLHEHDEPVTVTQLAANVIEHERSVDDVSHSERQCVSEDLYEHHIPKLTATAVVTYNSRQASIELNDIAPPLSDKLFDRTD
jgi:predicted Zn-ribbon and HTH transcriptional regulator